MSGTAETLRQVETKGKICAECGARFGRDATFCPFDGQLLSAATWDAARDARMPARVAGRYDVGERLGEGGMGIVYRVHHVALDRAFAMKVLRRDVAGDPGLGERFLREARATALIRHPGVVEVTDFGTLEDGTPWFVMELLRGLPLARELARNGPLPAARVVALGRKIADALAASHAANVIHRDVKPENVFVLGEDIRIVDFGTAKIIGTSALTRPGIVFGTPSCMAPEQARGETIDARADVYALGVLLFELTTGHAPFRADTYMGVLAKHLFDAPPAPTAASGPPCPGLEQVILRALAKDPAERFASMNDFRCALDGVAEPVPPQRGRSGLVAGALALGGGVLAVAGAVLLASAALRPAARAHANAIEAVPVALRPERIPVDPPPPVQAPLAPAGQGLPAPPAAPRADAPRLAPPMTSATTTPADPVITGPAETSLAATPLSSSSPPLAATVPAALPKATARRGDEFPDPWRSASPPASGTFAARKH